MCAGMKCVGWLAGVVVVTCLAGALQAQLVEADQGTDARIEPGQEAFGLLLQKVEWWGENYFDRKGRLPDPGEGTLKLSLLLRGPKGSQLIHAGRQEVVELAAEPALPLMYERFVAAGFDLLDWGRHGSAGDIQQPEEISFYQYIKLPLGPIQSLRTVTIRWQLTYATGDPLAVRIEPVAEHLGQWMGVDAVPGMKVRLTLDKPHKQGVSYRVEVSTAHRLHLSRVMFFDAAGEQIKPITTRKTQVRYDVHTIKRPVDYRQFRLPGDTCHSILLVVFPRFQSQEVTGTFQNLSVLRSEPGVKTTSGINGTQEEEIVVDLESNRAILQPRSGDPTQSTDEASE